MSSAKPISDPIASKEPSKDYPWWLEDIDHKITPEVSETSVIISCVSLTRILRCGSSLSSTAAFRQIMFKVTFTPL
jgi:hypothetical protein